MLQDGIWEGSRRRRGGADGHRGSNLLGRDKIGASMASGKALADDLRSEAQVCRTLCTPQVGEMAI